MASQPIFPGERYITMCPGGGGYGNPLDREMAKVRRDVEDGIVTVQRAHDVYGVVLDPATLEVDQPATKKRRAELRAKQQ
jgi:N-methylhydantoinase B